MPDIVLSLTPAQAQRVATAFGAYWNLRNTQGSPRDATLDEVKIYLVRQLRGIVRQQERRAAESGLLEPAEVIVT